MKRKNKVLLFFSALCLGALAAGALCACGEDRTVTVVFHADGSEAIVIFSKAGSAVTPPEVPEKTGNFGYWDHDGSWNFDRNTTIRAVYETKGLHYTLNSEKNTYSVDKGTMDPKTAELYIPSEYQGLPVEGIADNGFHTYAEGEAQLDIHSVTLPEQLKYIDRWAFCSNRNLCSVTLPESMIRLGNDAFASTGLKSLTIPKNLQQIESGAFFGCQALESVVFLTDSISFEDAIFSASGLVSVSLPKKTKSIPARMFSLCSSLQTVEIPNGVTSIGEYAFAGSGLRSIEIPGSVTSIGKRAFESCYSLQSVKIATPSKLKTIGDSAFSVCESLQSFNLPDGVTSIERWAFANCNSLMSLTIPSSVETIEISAFMSWSAPQTFYVKGRTEAPEGWFGNWNNGCPIVWDA